MLQINAREMRNAMPDCEKRLWQHLRGKRMEGFKFRRQYPIDRFIADFASIQARLVVEVDGDHHGNDHRARLDLERTAALEKGGWRVVRFWTHELQEDMDYVLDVIREALKAGPVP